jgi:hypothetical protein
MNYFAIIKKIVIVLSNLISYKLYSNLLISNKKLNKDIIGVE